MHATRCRRSPPHAASMHAASCRRSPPHAASTRPRLLPGPNHPGSPPSRIPALPVPPPPSVAARARSHVIPHYRGVTQSQRLEPCRPFARLLATAILRTVRSSGSDGRRVRERTAASRPSPTVVHLPAQRLPARGAPPAPRPASIHGVPAPHTCPPPSRRSSSEGRRIRERMAGFRPSPTAQRSVHPLAVHPTTPSRLNARGPRRRTSTLL